MGNNLGNIRFKEGGKDFFVRIKKKKEFFVGNVMFEIAIRHRDKGVKLAAIKKV